MKEEHYSIEQLIHNSSFRRIAQGTASSDEIEEWSRWIESNSKNREKAKKAIAEIVGFTFRNSAQINVDPEWNRLQHSINKKKNAKVAQHARKDSSWKWIYRVAAVLFLAGTIGAGVYYFLTPHQSLNQLEKITEFKTIETGPQERKTLQFSNGSKIKINSNTKLSYEVGLLDDQTVRVNLDGEAYFESGRSELSDTPSFLIRTTDGIITDIGTTFLVSVKDNHSRVILQEGRINIRQINVWDSINTIEMEKGELVKFNGSDVIDHKNVNATFYTSWATGNMQFDETTIQQFARFVEQKFNIAVKVVDPSIKSIKMDGTIYFNSLEELVRSVSDVVRIPVYQSRDKKIVYIGNQ